MNHKTFYFLQCWLTVNTLTYSAQIIHFPHFSKLRFVLKDSSFIPIFERFYNLASLRTLVVFTLGEVFVCLLYTMQIPRATAKVFRRSEER